MAEIIAFFTGAPWQDVVIAIGNWIFVIALIPTVRAKEKPALSTSILTGAVLAVFSFTFSTLSLLNSAVSAAAISITWFILAGQKLLRNQKK